MADNRDQSRIKRGKKQDSFTIIDNRPLEDKTLSWKAKGLLTYLMSKPENWEVKLWQLKEASRDGRDSTDAGLKELMANGYIRRTRLTDKKGRFQGYLHEVSDIAIFDTEAEKSALEQNKTINGFSENGNTENGETVSGNTENGETVNGKPAYNNTIYSNKDLKNTDLESVCVEQNTHTPFEENLGMNPKLATSDLNKFSQKRTSEHTFEQSPYADFENFKKLLHTLNFAQVDADYYFKKISAFCKSKGTKKQDFAPYIEMWLTDDQKGGKLKLATTAQASKPAVKTTTDYNPTETITQKLDEMDAYAFKSGKATRQWCESAIQTLMQLFPQASPKEQQRIDLLGYNINELLQTLPPDKPAQEQPPTTNKRKSKPKTKNQ